MSTEFRVATLLLALLCLAADDVAPTFKHQVTGLFSTDREADLRETMEKLPHIKLVSIDFKNAEAVFAYTPAKAFPGAVAKPAELVKQFDNKLRSVSYGTFGIKPLRTMPLEKFKRIGIAVAGLDCKGCCLGAYEAVYKLEGVEMATASFREGLVVAWIDPEKTDRGKLEEALRKKSVQVLPTEPSP